MKFKQVVSEAHILDATVRSAKSLVSLAHTLSKYKDKEKKASSLIQSYLSGIGAGSSKSIHQHGNDVQSLVSAVSLYLDGGGEMKKVAVDEYSKTMGKIIKRMYS